MIYSIVPTLGSLNQELSNSKFRLLYLFFSISLALAACARLIWSWPNVLWQSEFWIFDDVHHLVHNQFGSLVWFEAGNRDWSLNAWRWFSYVNAYFFGWNMYLELIVYFAIVLVLAQIIGLVTLKKLNNRNRWGIFIFPIIMLSLVGAGARGMELGTYFGVLLTVHLIVVITNNKKSLANLILLPGVIVFITSGGYAIGCAVSSLVLFAIGITPSIRAQSPILLFKSTVASCSFAIWLGAYAILYLRGVRSAGSSSLWSVVQHDPFYFVKFVFYAMSGSVFSEQTVEGFNHQRLILQIVSSLLLLLTIYSAIKCVKNFKVEAVAPIGLLAYSLSTVLLIMVTRPTGDLGMLATWYSLHLKIGLIGVVWISLLYSNEIEQKILGRFRLDLSLWLGAVIPVAVIFSLVTLANLQQYKREPSERAYFANIQSATLFPGSISADSNGLTPLLLPLKESRVVIEQMKADKLSLYSQKHILPLGIVESNKGYISLGDAYNDGWVGKNSQINVTSVKCQNLTLSFLGYEPALPNLLLLSLNGEKPKRVELGSQKSVVSYRNLLIGDSVSARFNRGAIPSIAGLGKDQRVLSAFLTVECGK